ncbi:MAG TPA: glycosyltransferase [Gaiellaceae bacterium]|nr:glycosyltransferase [Gaiellaceae bacterium]
MRRLVFATQKLDPADPILAATVPMVRALAERVDELVVLCDAAAPGAAPANARVHEFGSATQAQRGARFAAALARELRPRPLGVVAHMVPLYALVAAPLVRPLRLPLVLWYTHWKAHAVVRAAERVCTAVATVDRRSFPYGSPKVRPIGHAIDLADFPCAEPAPADGPLRALVLGRYSPAKGLETILRAAALAGGVRVECHGSTADGEYDGHKRELERLAAGLGLDCELGGPVPRAEVPALLARSHVLVNNMREGATDKVVFEAAASCVPALASNPAFDDLLPPELRFPQDGVEALAARLRALDRRRRPELRETVRERHSVEHWADALLATVAGA